MHPGRDQDDTSRSRFTAFGAHQPVQLRGRGAICTGCRGQRAIKSHQQPGFIDEEYNGRLCLRSMLVLRRDRTWAARVLAGPGKRRAVARYYESTRDGVCLHNRGGVSVAL